MSIFSRLFKFCPRKSSIKAAVDLQQPNISTDKTPKTSLEHDIEALYSLLIDIEGADHLVLKASKFNALAFIRSNDLHQRILGLQKIIYEDPSINDLPPTNELPQLLKEMTNYLANIIARRSLDEEFDKLVNAKMEENHQEYIADIKKQLIAEETSLKNSSQALAKLQELEAKDKIHLTKSILDLLRPQDLTEIVGQSTTFITLWTTWSR